MKPIGKVELGIDVFLKNHIQKLKKDRIGLVCNHASLNSDLIPTADLLIKKHKLNIIKILAPEHGIKGIAEAGEQVDSFIDDRYGIPVFSLYDITKAAELSNSGSLDESMRIFDVLKKGKTANQEILTGIDTIIFDLQDVGTRIYTYASTLLYLMESGVKSGIKIIILDRPNPINGKDIEGPLLKYPEFSSFIGVAPIPIRHSMTIGELARFFNGELLKNSVDLEIILMNGWKREMYFEDTGLHWINPSPNLPTPKSVYVYPGQVLFEGTNVSEGRGTTLPFEILGAPWINGYKMVDILNNLNIDGVKFIETYFSPHFSKYRGDFCSGLRIEITDKIIYKPFKTTLHIISELFSLYQNGLKFHSSYFDHVCGTTSIRKSILNGIQPEKICNSFNSDLEKFKDLRNRYILYS